MYHHFLRRLLVVTSPIIQSLQSQSSQQSFTSPPPGFSASGTTTITFPGDKPLERALEIPSVGAGVLAWRLLESEGRRASRDVSLSESGQE